MYGLKKRHITAAIILLALVLGLCGCKAVPNTKMINGETFVSEAEQFGLEVTDMMTGEYEDDFYNLYQADSEQLHIQFFYAKDEMVANYLYTNDYNTLREKIVDGCSEEEFTNSTFTKLAVTFPEGERTVVVRSGCTYMYLEATASGRAVLDLFLEEISY